ncbi:MAG TPA: hypothetical protein PLB21_11900, partial [Actinomycetota bacterium]|nr:hypothetical protein [Actinomycetota bacterium]
MTTVSTRVSKPCFTHEELGKHARIAASRSNCASIARFGPTSTSMNQDPDLSPIVGRGLSEGQVSQEELPRMYMMPSE